MDAERGSRQPGASLDREPKELLQHILQAGWTDMQTQEKLFSVFHKLHVR